MVSDRPTVVALPWPAVLAVVILVSEGERQRVGDLCQRREHDIGLPRVPLADAPVVPSAVTVGLLEEGHDGQSAWMGRAVMPDDGRRTAFGVKHHSASSLGMVCAASNCSKYRRRSSERTPESLTGSENWVVP